MNLISDRIQFTVGDYSEFDLELRGNIVVVDGNSGQGKTYFFNSLRNKQLGEIDANVYGVDLNKVCFINIFTKGLINILHFIREQSNKLIIIDNADFLLTEEIAEYIGWDNKNQYLLFARGSWPLNISPNYFARMVNKGGKHILEYDYQCEGWV